MGSNDGHFSKTGMFLIGFFMGVLALALGLLVAARYAWKHPEFVYAKAANLGLKRAVERTLASAPREYIGTKQEDIAATAQAFARAYSENRVSAEDVQALGGRVVGLMADQTITPEEIDGILEAMRKTAGVQASPPAVPAP